MKERVTKVRKKTANGFAEAVPIGAKALDITLLNGTILQDVLDVLQRGQAGHEVLTQAEYNALPNSQKNDGTVYFVEDGIDDNNRTLASIIAYNNNSSQLNSTDVQGAIDELRLSTINTLASRTQLNGLIDYTVTVNQNEASTQLGLLKLGFKKAFKEYFLDRKNAIDNNSILGGVGRKTSKFFNLSVNITGTGLSRIFSFDVIGRDNFDYIINSGSAEASVVFIAIEANGLQNGVSEDSMYYGHMQLIFDMQNNSFEINDYYPNEVLLYELAPRIFNNRQNSIQFQGTGSTHAIYDMIRFIDNTTDDYGYGIAIGGGGSTIIGGGESATNILNSTFWPTSSGQLQMIIANDTSIAFVSNVQSGVGNQKIMTYDSDGNLLVSGGGGVFVGAGKTAQYTYPGVMLHPLGYVCLTNSTTTGSRGGIYFAYNNASSPTSHIKEITSGNLQVGASTAFIGPNKTTLYNTPGVALSQTGIITLTSSDPTGGGAIHFSWNRAGGPRASIVLSGGSLSMNVTYLHVGSLSDSEITLTPGRIQLYGKWVPGGGNGTLVKTPSFLQLEMGDTYQGLISSGYFNGSTFVENQKSLIYRHTDGRIYTQSYNSGAGTPIISEPSTNKHISSMWCNTATQLAIYGEWASTSHKTMYVTVSSSDPKLKKNINNCNIDALSVINKIPLHSFDWKDNNKHWDVGFVAPELYEIDLRLAIKPEKENEIWGVDDFYLTGLQTKAIQLLSELNEKLKAKVDFLELRLAKIEELLNGQR